MESSQINQKLLGVKKVDFKTTSDFPIQLEPAQKYPMTCPIEPVSGITQRPRIPDQIDLVPNEISTILASNFHCIFASP